MAAHDVEVAPDRGRARGPHCGHLRVKPVGTAGGQHHDGAGGQPNRQFAADLAAPPENHHDTTVRVSRVVHGSDYVLR